MKDYWWEGAWINLVEIDPSLNNIILLLNSISIRNQNDMIIWDGNTSSLVSVTSTYLGSLGDQIDSFNWNKVWISSLIPIINIFLCLDY